MRNAEFTPQERALIERVQNAPQPDLKPDTYARMRQQLLAEVDLVPAPGTQPRLSPHLSALTIIIVVVAALAVAALVFVFLQQAPSQVAFPTAQPSLTSTLSGETLMPTLVVTQTPFLESMGEITAETAEATPAPTMTATPSVTLESVMVIEGPVSAINGNIITVFDMNIQVTTGDAVLTSIKIGDTLQVTGRVTVENGALIVVAMNLTVVRVDMPAAAPNSALPADCKITKKGHIKCSKKK